MIKKFLKPASVTEAVELINKNRGSAYFSGGTWINHAERPYSELCAVSLENLGLDNIEESGNGLKIGALVTLQTIIDSEIVPGVLREASSFIYSRNIRNIATIGGNIGAGETDSALIPCLIALSSSVETHEHGILPVEKYVADSMKSLILSIIIPINGSRCFVKKYSRTAASAAVINTAVSLRKNGSAIEETVIAVGGLGAKVLRLSSIENALISGNLKKREEIEKSVSDSISAVSDSLGTAAYKKYISGVAVAACIEECMGEYK